MHVRRTAGMVPAAILTVTAVAGVLLRASAGPVVVKIDDFESGDLSHWQSSMSPEYYKGGAGRKGLAIVADPERGQVLRCDIRFTDPQKSEPAFITRVLERPVRRLNVLGVRFKAKLTGAGIAPSGGFKVRLRTSPRAFTDYDVQEQLGGPFPVGRWVAVHLNTAVGPSVRNVWGTVLDKVRQITFRLDDVDAQNAHFALLLDDIELIVRGPSQKTYHPVISPRSEHRVPRVLLLKHRAAGYYDIEEALGRVAPGVRIDRFDYRGHHFEFFGFPKTRKEVLDYDLIVMVDVDPIMMTFEQCAWIADAVASGAHLLVFDGPVSLTHAGDWKVPLRVVLPVTFTEGAKDIPVHSPPAPGPPHFLNRGFDAGGLGVVGAVQDVQPRAGAVVPWTAGGRPLVVTGTVGRGRSTLVNTWPHVKKSASGDFFTSPLSDDLMRRLVRFGLGRTGGPGITHLDVSAFSVIGAGRVTVRVGTSAEPAQAFRLLVDGRPVNTARAAGNGLAEFAVNLTGGELCEERRVFRVEYRKEGAVADFRDFPVLVRNPLDLEAAWRRSRFTFAPGGLVEFETALRLRGLPQVAPGVVTEVRAADGGFPVRVEGFADAWVYQPGSDYIIHNQKGSANVLVVPEDGILPGWTVTGDVRCARADGSHRFAADDRILACRRTIRVLPDGAVSVVTRCEFRASMRVHRLPLTVVLPVGVFAGMPFRVVQAGGERRGRFPLQSTPGKLFDGTGMKLTVATPRGPLRIEVTDPSLRVWMRDLRPYEMPSFRIEIEAPFQGKHADKGAAYTIPLRIVPPGAGSLAGNAAFAEFAREAPEWRAVIRDARGDAAWPVPMVEHSGAGARFAGVLPNLASGDYTLDVAALCGGRVAVRTARPCYVVDPLDRTDFFPIMSIIGIAADGHYLAEPGIEARVRDLIEHGFNTAAVTGMGSFRTDRPDNAQRLNAFAESFAQRSGMAATFEYSTFSFLRRKGKTSPCVYDPRYGEALEEHLGWKIDVARRTPRLLSAKVVDEPYIGMANMDFCKYCRAEFRKRYGIPMPTAVPPESQPYARWALARFISGYVSRAYAAVKDLIRRKQGNFDLLLTYMATGLGYQSPLKMQQDTLDWSRYVQWADFDVYPYFYPRSQRIRMVQAGFCMAFMRDVARLRGIPWGFYVELDDRNWPFQKNPKEASGECAFTAVARGAEYLNTFINRVVGTGTQARPERWEAAGRALRLVRRIGPMLCRMPAVRANLALCYPNTQEAVGNGYERPDYGLAALNAGFGDVDVYNERAAIETRRIPYPALVLWKTEYVHADFAPVLAAWLRQGGTLFCDHLPEKTHRGASIRWDFPETPAGEAAAGAIGPIRFSVHSVGKGRIVRIRNDVQTEFRDLVEADSVAPHEVAAYRRALGAVFRRYVRPNIHVFYRETRESVDLVEAGLRGNADSALVIVVNHQPKVQRVRVRLRRRDLGCFVDADSARPLPFQVLEDGDIQLTVDVEGRWARCIAGYRARPYRLDLEIPPTMVRRGGSLRYRVTVRDAEGCPVRGGVLLDCEVCGPDGARVRRFGGARAPADGLLSVDVPVPVNALPGAYRLSVTAPLFGLRAHGLFHVAK